MQLIYANAAAASAKEKGHHASRNSLAAAIEAGAASITLVLGRDRVPGVTASSGGLRPRRKRGRGVNPGLFPVALSNLYGGFAKLKWGLGRHLTNSATSGAYRNDGAILSLRRRTYPFFQRTGKASPATAS